MTQRSEAQKRSTKNFADTIRAQVEHRVSGRVYLYADSLMCKAAQMVQNLCVAEHRAKITERAKEIFTFEENV